MDKAVGYFRRVVKESNDASVQAVATEREIICEAMRVLFTPYAPSGKGLAPPTIRPEGLAQSLAVFRTLSRMVKDAARIETPFLRVFDACYGYLLKYNLPVSEGVPSACGSDSDCPETGGPFGPTEPILSRASNRAPSC